MEEGRGRGNCQVGGWRGNVWGQRGRLAGWMEAATTALHYYPSVEVIVHHGERSTAQCEEGHWRGGAKMISHLLLAVKEVQSAIRNSYQKHK